MRIVLILFCFAVVIFSCRSTRKISTAMTKKDTAVVVINPVESDSAKMVHDALEKIKGNHIDFNTFSAKIKVDYADSKEQRYDFNAFVRMKKDSVIWISINAALGIEAFRVLITQDSVRVLDKLNKTVQYHTLDYLQEVAQLPFDFYTLQDLIIGNPVYMDSNNIVAYKEDANFVSLATKGNYFKHLVTFIREGFSLQHSKLDDVDIVRSRTADLSYEAYENSGERKFSTNRRITIAEKAKLDIDMKFKQVEFNQPLNFPFAVPRNYKLK